MKNKKAAATATTNKPAALLTNVVQFQPATADIRRRIQQVAKLDGITQDQLVNAAVIGYLDGTSDRNRYFDSIADGPLCHREYVEIMKPERFVDVTLQVPQSALAVFPGPRLARLHSACAFDDKSVADRVRAWKEPHGVGIGGIAPPTSKHLADMLKEGCTVTAGFRFPEEEWKHVEKIALILKITVGEYLLGCVGYAVSESRQPPAKLPEGFRIRIE
ncbi:hypothetical protein [Luteolibacter soli]|uniref:Nitroreductase domain-containing protein n=1 Tax=Luteolibacter soli TaxID=3135280 RepID=A0ABU9AUT3_9BACT